MGDLADLEPHQRVIAAAIEQCPFCGLGVVLDVDMADVSHTLPVCSLLERFGPVDYVKAAITHVMAVNALERMLAGEELEW